jgi:hypothetical protein
VSVAKARGWASRQEGPSDASVIQAGLAGGWVVTVEPNGYQAAFPEALHRVSEASRAIVVLRNVQSHTSFLYAVDGVVIRSFDPVLYDDPTPWDGPPLPEESGLDFGSSHPMASVLACAERLTGVRLTPELLSDHDDWLAVGHHPLHSLRDAGSWAAVEKSNAERQACEEDPRRRSIPNRLLWGEEVYDTTDLLMPGWIGWIQLLLCCVAMAPLLAIEHGVGVERLDELSSRGALLVILFAVGLLLVLTGLTRVVRRTLERIGSCVSRKDRSQSWTLIQKSPSRLNRMKSSCKQ